MEAVDRFRQVKRALVRYRGHIRTVAKGFAASRKPPIFVVGLPRSGTTWVASVLNTARSVKYFHEPLNCTNVPGAAKFCMRYLTPDHNDLEFVQRSRDAFAGRATEASVRGMLRGVYRRYPRLPGRIIVKGVCSCMAVESIFESVSPRTVIVIRHPCAVAASWHRLRYDLDRHIATLLNQPYLLGSLLKPFQNILARAEGFWQKMGALWGAAYYVLLQQCGNHPEWIVVQHEQLCRDAEDHFRRLFDALDLAWTRTTDRLLEVSTKTGSTQPYLIHRVSEQEPDKWRSELSDEQAEQVLRFARPFEIAFYRESDAGF